MYPIYGLAFVIATVNRLKKEQGMFAKIFSKKPQATAAVAQALYNKVVNQARNPVIFQKFAIPDTVEGRFESLALHLFIVLNTLKRRHEPATLEISQHLCDMFVADMDHSLRSMSMSEGKINTHIKKFVEGFYGRLVAYDQAFAEEKQKGLLQSLQKNIYGYNNSPLDMAQGLSDYAITQIALMDLKPITDLEFVTLEGL